MKQDEISEETGATVGLEPVGILDEGADIDTDFDYINSSGSISESLALKELVQRVIGHGAINRETNALCTQILNNPEVHMHPEVLPSYESYNGEFHYFCHSWA